MSRPHTIWANTGWPQNFKPFWTALLLGLRRHYRQQRQHVEKVLKVPLSSPSTPEVEAMTKLSISVKVCGATSVTAGC